MMIIMKRGASDAEINHVVDKLHAVGAQAHVSKGEFATIIGAIETGMLSRSCRSRRWRASRTSRPS